MEIAVRYRTIAALGTEQVSEHTRLFAFGKPPDLVLGRDHDRTLTQYHH